ncbi:MAG: ABC transporter permease [Chitinophagaceae bacterium]|nr:ABC transporter permease [Chitinophagaceae bacterium]
MLWTYLKIAYRNLKKNRLLTFINLFGLAFSMSVGMMQLIILQKEFDYDKFHPYPERTYRVLSDYTQKNGNHWKLASTPIPMYNLLLTDTAAIEQTVNIYPALKGIASIDGKELYLNGAFTEPSFFKIFGFSLAQGNPQTALQQPNTLVLSRAAAVRFFGGENPIGKSLNIQGTGLFLVTGVLSEPPGSSHLDFDAYASASTVPVLEKNKLLPARSANWNELMISYTYILAKEGTNKRLLEGHLQMATQRFNAGDQNGNARFELQPIEKVRPADDHLYNDIGGGTAWSKLWIGIDISLIILIAACFNYTNLTIARALTRAKEVGVRKIVGARRYQIFTQYLMESILQAFLALAISWLLLSLIVRYAPFNDGYEMVPSSWKYNLPYFFYTIGFALFTGLLAGVAPAVILSAFQPVRVLKNLSTAKIFGKVGLQKSLIVFQYSLSLVIIIFLTTFFRQFSMLSAADPGFKKDNVLVLPLEGTNASLVAPKLEMISGVRTVSPLSVLFTPHFSGTRSDAKLSRDRNDAVSLNNFFTDNTFIPSMNIQLLAGRNFGTTSDTTGEREIILNARALKGLGITSYEEALGKKLWLNDSTSLEIIGVVNDFKYENAGKPVDPIAFRNKKGACKYLYATVNGTDRSALLQRVAAMWQSVAPKKPFSASWLDEVIADNNSQRATISLLGYLAFIALSIATLGLLGLVIYTVETKRKETGIRKVIGASSRQIISLLSKKFIWLLAIAGFIAIPIGYTMSFLFLQNFVDRVGNGFFSAIACFLFLLSIGLLVIFSQTYRASRENPVASLRTE